MPTETLLYIQAVCSRALEIWKDAFTLENVVSWMLLAFTAIIALDDWDAYAGIKSVCKEDENPRQTKIELSDVLLTTKGHNDSSVWKRYTLVQIVAAAVILMEELFLKKNYFSTGVSIAAIVMSVVNKRNSNKKYDELNKRIAEETSKNEEGSEPNTPEQVQAEANDLSVDEQAEALLSNTAINEYLAIVRSEYEIERNKKQSFENRAGLIMALVGATCIFVFEQINLSSVFLLLFAPMTFLVFLKIVSGFGVYIGFAFTMTMIIRTISIKQHDNFEVKNIDEELLSEHRAPALIRIIKTYRAIIMQHRELNEIRAKSFRWSLYGVTATLITIVVYITLV